MSLASLHAITLAAILALPSFALAYDLGQGVAANDAAIYCAEGVQHPQTIKQMIVKEAARQDVDGRLALAIADQESGYGARVNSPAGARGPMQLMPATAFRYNVSDICDAAQNIRGGVSYLKDLTTMFGGNIMLVVAAYNAGEGRVVAARGVPAIGETVSYTALVTNAYYGFDNILSGDKQASRSSRTQGRAKVSGVDLLSAAPATDKPIPINQTKTETSDRDWIGGSVLYVQ